MKTAIIKATCAFFSIILILMSTFPLREAKAKCLSNNTYTKTYNFARVLNNPTTLYSDKELKNVKFNLPTTYFVKILSLSDQVAEILYFDDEQNSPFQEGYINKEDLFIFDGIPENPYPKVILQLKCDEILFSDIDKRYPKTILQTGDTALFYGDIAWGTENFYYVYSNGYIGYVRKNSFIKSVIPNHPLPIETEDEKDEESISPEKSDNIVEDNNLADSKGLTNFQLIFIVGLTLFLIVVIYIMLRPKNSSLKTAVTDFEDDEN